MSEKEWTIFFFGIPFEEIKKFAVRGRQEAIEQADILLFSLLVDNPMQQIFIRINQGS